MKTLGILGGMGPMADNRNDSGRYRPGADTGDCIQ